MGELFPLLIKFIDARDRLSVQVHPDDDYARDVENDRGKTEMWYIVDAAEDAEIIYGLAEGMDNAAFRRAFTEGRVLDAANRVKVQRGETYFIPSGLLHAIGDGCLIGEIQQNSDLTYRVYDYDRRGADGKLRELHVASLLLQAVGPEPDDLGGYRPQPPERGKGALGQRRRRIRARLRKQDLPAHGQRRKEDQRDCRESSCFHAVIIPNGSAVRNGADHGRPTWCTWWDLNPHALRHWNLNPACLPFHHRCD